MLQIIRCAFPYSSSTPRLLLTSPAPSSLSHSLSLSHSPPSHKQQSGQIAGQPKRADHLSTSEYWKPATGAVEHNKSFSYQYTHFRPAAAGAIHSARAWVYVCLSPCHHLDAGEINSDAGQPLKPAP